MKSQSFKSGRPKREFETQRPRPRDSYRHHRSEHSTARGGLSLVPMLAYLSVLVGGHLVLLWTALESLIVASIVTVLIGSATYFAASRSGIEITAHRMPRSHVAGLLQGVLFGLLGLAICGVGQFVIPHLPLRRVLVDADRAAVEEKLRTLEEAQAFEAAAELIAKRLDEPLSDGYRAELASRRVRLLIGAAGHAQDRDRKRHLLQTAVDVAAEAAVSGREAELELRLLGIQMQEPRAIVTPAQNREEVSSAAAFPVGMRAQLMRSYGNTSQGITACDIHVERASRFVRGLRADNFRVTDSSDRARIFRFAELASAAEPLHVVFLIDESPSTVRMTPIMHDVAMEFARRGEGKCEFLAISFADGARLLTTWTSDASEMNRGLGVATQGERTSLDNAIHVAMHHLRQRTGKRIVILLSDGDHNARTPFDTDSIRRTAEASRIQIVAIGFDTPKLDEDRLRTVARMTRGGYRRVGNHKAIVDWFDRLASAYRGPVYRLFFDEPIRDQAKITVGSGPAQVTLDLSHADRFARTSASTGRP